MAYDKVVDSAQLDADLKVVADAIREKGGTTEPLEFPLGMKEAVEAIQSGGGSGENINLLDYATFRDGRVFFGAKFPDNTEIKIKPNWSTPNLTNQFNYTNAKSYTIDLSSTTSISMNVVFNGCSSCTDITLIGVGANVNNYNGTFQDCVLLETINGELDFTNVTNVKSMFNQCRELKNVKFKENTLALSIDVAWSGLLTDESIQSIIDGLKDLTETTAQTLTLPTNVKLKLTETQLATITGKNWTLA